jgi:hypothetical protein
MNIFESAFKFLSENAAVIATVSGIIFGIVKAVSNEKAPMVVKGLQNGVDAIAAVVSGLGKVLGFISEFLANLIRSDGFMGKK